jgi:hypothetical protein
VSKSQPDVHLTPDEGLQTFTEPYPRYVAEHQAGTRLAGRQVVAVTAVKGSWAHVSVNGTPVGWVDGRKLLPPVSAPIRMAAIPQTSRARRRVFVVSLEAVVGALASVGIAVGALLDWTQGRHAVSAMQVPVQYLIDNKTTAEQPHIGYFLIGIAVVAFVLSFIPRAAIWRVLLGAIVVAIVSAFWMQVAEAMSNSNKAIVDVVGAGVWVAGFSGLLLVCSPLFRRAIA